eukprot:GFKZ01013584.1.p1 GENE.GFKZ01013584.1~~GFKZ01013584.1.p1  ORF type:complete len:858 (+),score=140.23 GFKZ01013584.1:137-2710(+)
MESSSISLEERLDRCTTAAIAPLEGDQVYLDECMFSFDTPESPGGLYTSLKTWQSFGRDYVDKDYEKTGNQLYLKQVTKRVAVDGSEDSESNPEKAPSKLAIGVKGGFAFDKLEYDKDTTTYLVVFPEKHEIKLPSPIVPPEIQLAIHQLWLCAQSQTAKRLVSAWEGVEQKESKYAKDLPQLETGKKIPPDPKQWKCEESGMTENLWLNLSTGYIGSGRRNWDGSGGTGAALSHYEKTGRKYPLAVKLGTITPQGADVYSYAPDEDDMVLDPYLAQHLSHWGINMMQQEKTEKTMAELQVDLNQSYQFDKITESGSDLVPLHGPGYIGMRNLGNSCYMASIMQILVSLPEIASRYKDNEGSIFASAPKNPAEDLLTNMAKLVLGLLSDRYSKPTPVYEKDPAGTGELVLSTSKVNKEYGIVAPFRFKKVVGKGSSEFSSSRQQDASEFFQYFLDKLTKAERKGRRRFEKEAPFNLPTEALFRFKVEERIEDCQTKKVRYISRTENILSLAIDMNAATNKAQYDEFEEERKKRLAVEDISNDDIEPVQLQIPLSACLQKFGELEQIEDFLSPETGVKGSAIKRTRLQTYPQYLVIHLKRYYVAEDWKVRKLEASVLMPTELDLSDLRGTGRQPDEELLPDDPPESAASEDPTPEVVPNPKIVGELMAMGFSENGSKRAALATGNSSVDDSMEWVFSHLEDPDFNDPIPSAKSGKAESSAATNKLATDIAHLLAMGFTEAQAKAALKANGGSLERAADWLFTQANSVRDPLASNTVDDLDSEDIGDDENIDEDSELIDGEPKYELHGFASHLGSNTSCGHYVAHIKKEGRFVLYNDGKVAVSQNPPTDLGFIYFYRRR